jgi:hypothetical protein
MDTKKLRQEHSGNRACRISTSAASLADQRAYLFSQNHFADVAVLVQLENDDRKIIVFAQRDRAHALNCICEP